MNYVESVLQADEQVLRIARRHWITYGGATLWSFACFALLLLASRVDPDAMRGAMRPALAVAAVIAGLIALTRLLHTAFVNGSIELAVTNRRVIYKSGLIRRHSIEMNMDKIESVAVDQTVPGRLLDYGTVHIRGTGQSIENLRLISKPIAARNAIVAR